MKNENIRTLLEREFGLDELDAESRRIICDELGEIIADRLYLGIAQRLSAEDLGHFDAMVARTDSSGEISTFLGEKYPEYADMIRSLIADLKRVISEDVRPLMPQE